MDIKDVLCVNELVNKIKKGESKEDIEELSQKLSSLYYCNTEISENELNKLINYTKLDVELREDIAEKNMCSSTNKKCFSCKYHVLRRIEEELFLYYLLNNKTKEENNFITSLRIKPNVPDIKLYYSLISEMHKQYPALLNEKKHDLKKHSDYYLFRTFIINALRKAYNFSDEQMRYPTERIEKMLERIETIEGIKKILENYETNKEAQEKILQAVEIKGEKFKVKETEVLTEEEIITSVSEELAEEEEEEIEEQIIAVSKEASTITSEEDITSTTEEEIKIPLKIGAGVPSITEKIETSSISIALDDSAYKKEPIKEFLESVKSKEFVSPVEIKTVQMEKFFIPNCTNIEVKGQKDCEKYGHYFLAQKEIFIEYVNPNYAVLFQTEQNTFYHLSLDNHYVSYAFESVLKSGAYPKITWSAMELEKANKFEVNNLISLSIALRLLENISGVKIEMPISNNIKEQIFNNLSLHNTIRKNIDLKKMENELIFERLVARSEYKELVDNKWTFYTRTKDGYNVLFARVNNLDELGIDSYTFYKNILINIGRKDKVAKGLEIVHISDEGMILQTLPKNRIKINDLVIHRLDIVSKEISKDFVPDITINWK